MSWVTVQINPNTKKGEKPSVEDFIRKWSRIANDPYLARLYLPLMMREASGLGRLSGADARKVENLVSKAVAEASAMKPGDEEAEHLIWPLA